MARKDIKGRNLQKGERQRNDGRYEYRYTDGSGKTKSVYSWRLVETDRVPVGKPLGKALREMEHEINKDLSDGIICKDITLNEYFEVFMETKQGLKERSRIYYREIYNRYVRDVLGLCKLTGINYTTIKRLYNNLIIERNLSKGTMKLLNNVLHQVYECARKDRLVRENPTNGILKELNRAIKDPQPRVPLTIEEQTAFLKFISSSPYYRYSYPLFVFLLSTGCRVGEASGLKWKDCDFENNEIHIERTRAYSERECGGFGYIETSPKTKTSRRIIPMMTILKQLLIEEKIRYHNDHPECKDDSEVYVFHGRYGGNVCSGTVDMTLHNICKAYNKAEEERAAMENRAPVKLPDFTAHILRHTFCTRYSENESNIRAIMEIMGHSDIKTTMNIYSKATAAVKRTSMEELEAKVFIR